MEVIRSKDNSNVKKLSSLKDKKYRKEYGLFLVEGEKMIADGLAAGYVCDMLAVSESKANNFSHLLFNNRHIVVADNLFSQICDTVTPQGIIGAFVIDQNRPIVNNKCIILDRVRDAGNLGTIIRTAAAADWAVYMIDCVDIYSPKVIRSTMSGIFYAQYKKINIDDLDVVVANKRIIAADMNGINYTRYNIKDKNIALIMGNEAQGISKELKDICHDIISIPMNKVESLNVSVSAAILMYHFNNL